MEQRTTPKPTSRRPGARKNTRGRGLGLTTSQILVLSIITLLCVAAFGLGAFVLLSGGSSPNPTAPVAQQAASPTAELAAQPLSTPSPQPQQAPAAACLQAATQVSQGTVTQVIDTSTIEVWDAGKSYRVSFAGIDVASDSEAALLKSRSLLEGQPVMLINDGAGQDAKGRQMSYIFSGDIFVNLELVREGLAAASPAGPGQACAAVFQQAEQQARASHLGQWKAPTPVPTKTFMPFVTVDPGTNGDFECLKTRACSDFKTHDEAQQYFNACNDYSSKLDEDRDGIACEELP